MAEIILPPEENEETPQVPELNLDRPTENSKVITIEFEAKKTNKVSTKDTNQQLYTTDTDAWLKFKETSLEGASGTYSVVFRNLHDGSIFQRTGDVVSGVAYYKIPQQEIRHAGAWRGQVVYTLSNGDTTSREFGYDVKGHILDGKDVREIVVEDFETLMSQLRSMKDNAEVELAGLKQELENITDTANQNETDRQVFFDDLVDDIDQLQSNYQELLDTGVLQTNINTKLEQLEEEYAPKLTEVTTQLAQTQGGLASVQNANAKDFLRIENYLGNFENIHPKVINFETAWNGFKYWMAYTPYPGGDTTAENPCIAVSNDLINWTTPVGLVNPLDPYPGDGYNNDTHLLYRSDTNTIEIWWRYYRESDGKQLFYRRTSTNGVTWTSKELVFTSDLTSMVSPCVIFEGGKYKLWAVQGSGIIYMESSGSSVSTWTQPITLNIDWGEIRPWHMDIIRTDIGLEMVVQAYGVGGTNNTADLYYVRSDGNAFTKPKLILARNVDTQAFDSVGIYRASLIKEKGVYHLFYSSVGPKARRSMALSSGRSIFGLNGVTDRNERMLTVSDDSKTELSDQEIRDYDKFRFMGDGVTELSLIRGGYEGQRITLIIGKKSRNLKVVLKHKEPYLEMPNGKDFILETSGNYRVTMAVDLICQRVNEWKVVGPIPLDPATSGKSFHAVSAGGIVNELDVSNIDVVVLGGARIEVKSLKGGYHGKVVHFLAISGATNATIVNSTRLITLGNTNYVFTPAKMGMTAICMSPEPYNVWRVF